jgi:hypothetical protein
VIEKEAYSNHTFRPKLSKKRLDEQGNEIEVRDKLIVEYQVKIERLSRGFEDAQEKARLAVQELNTSKDSMGLTILNLQSELSDEKHKNAKLQSDAMKINSDYESACHTHKIEKESLNKQLKEITHNYNLLTHNNTIFSSSSSEHSESKHKGNE